MNRWLSYQPAEMKVITAALELYHLIQVNILASEMRGQTHDYTPVDRLELQIDIDTIEDLLDDIDYQQKWITS